MPLPSCRVLVLILLLSSCAFRSWSADSDAIGYVKIAHGKAFVSTRQIAVDAQPGTPIYQGSTLTTGSDGSLGITLKDNTVMSFGPDTEVSIDDYLYKPAQDRLKLAARIAKGTLHYLSGIIAKLKPEAVSINTPTGIIGVRGTRFAVKVED
ncbi:MULTISPECIES: FecR family protein [Methylomicrobium]|uniref:FecR protein domain-containing protein n=1 Tax=Methylomicrobium album BG8 TaxID=686340 RepID=H8GKE2_METAL|nr:MULTISPECIES: FecR family protein [Methylomicrobium]EIC30433.1 hypothetical protein Metal_2733 [Methylomicrobium album BG8]